MINKDLGYGYIDMPKCASRTMIKVLNHWYGGKRVSHQEAAQQPFVFGVLREPYQRCISLWWFIKSRGDRYVPRRYTNTMEEFMTWLVENGDSYRVSADMIQGRDLMYRMTEVFDPYRIDMYLRCETLGEDFKRLPFFTGEPQELPWENTNKFKRGPDSDFLTPTVVHLINTWCPDDFTEFGYGMRNP